MKRFGRLVALPWLMIALLLQGLAPAQAAAMQRDAFGFPICTAHDLGGSHRPGAPTDSRGHDCCAAACAVAGLMAAPPVQAVGARIAFAAPAGLRLAAPVQIRAAPPLRQPRARGPPPHLLTA